MAQQQANGPAIGLIVTAILGMVVSIATLLWNLSGGAGFDAAELGGSPELERLLDMLTGTFGLLNGVLGLLISAFVLYGASKMRKLENHTLSLVTSIVALIPCTSPCCCLGLPIGIWALVVLNRPEVKAHFK